MEKIELTAVVEGILFAAGDDGVTANQLAQVIDLRPKQVENILKLLMESYEDISRGLLILQTNNRYYLTTKPVHSTYLKRFLETPQTSKLSQAALETLAIIAYQQPITRTEIEEIRGVKSDRPVQTLLGRSLIEEIGRKEGIGRPALFGTTKEFMTFFGLTSLAELPELKAFNEDLTAEEIVEF